MASLVSPAVAGSLVLTGLAMFISEIVIAVFMLILYIFLVVGVRKERPSYLAFWCIMEIVFTSITIIQFLLVLINNSGAVQIMLPVVNGISIGLAIYFIIVVNSYRLELKEQQEERKETKTGQI